MKKWIYFSASVLLHILLGTSLAVFTKASKETTAPLAVELHIPVRQFVENRPPSLSGSTGAQPTPNLGMKILKQSGDIFMAKGPRAEPTEHGFELNDAQAYSAGETNLFGKNDNWPFHEEVHRVIDSELMFAPILARYNHFGSVFLEFAVNKKGFLLEKTLRASADDAILKVHVVRALRVALDGDFEPTKWSVLEKPVVFRAKFDFTHESSAVNREKQKAFSEPVLVFRRATAAQDVATYTTQDQYIGLFMDYERIGEKLKNRRNSKNLKAGQYDPFAGYREDPAYNL